MSGVRFSKVPKTARARKDQKHFGALFAVPNSDRKGLLHNHLTRPCDHDKYEVDARNGESVIKCVRLPMLRPLAV